MSNSTAVAQWSDRSSRSQHRHAFQGERGVVRMRQWELVELVSESELCRLFRARPTESMECLPSSYAIKTLRREWERDPRAVSLFAQEARLGRQFSHPHLISVLECSTSAAPYYLVMPWLRGWTLREIFDSRQPCRIGWRLWIARQAAQALEALHLEGWRHGDVKPANIHVSPEGHVTLLDLGFASPDGQQLPAVERFAFGTCNYLAPELLTSRLSGDIRSDLYSLGVVLFEMFARKLPFQGETLEELATQHKTALPPLLSKASADAPEELAQLVRRLLSKNPLRRPNSPAEVIDQLASLEMRMLGR